MINFLLIWRVVSNDRTLIESSNYLEYYNICITPLFCILLTCSKCRSANPEFYQHSKQHLSSDKNMKPLSIQRIISRFNCYFVTAEQLVRVLERITPALESNT